MEELQLEPLNLKTLPNDTQAVPFPFTQMSVPKSGNVSGPSDRVNELERMLADAQDRMAVLEREAYDKAYAAGEKAGMELGRKRAEQILAAMSEALESTSEQLNDIRSHASEAVIDIASALAEWLIGNLVDEDHARLLTMAEQMADTLPDSSEFKLAVHPDDLEKFQRLLDGNEHTKSILPDATIGSGSIRIFNKEQDILIDPHAVIADGVERVKKELLANGTARLS